LQLALSVVAFTQYARATGRSSIVGYVKDGCISIVAQCGQ
jgi:hypothetical protein